MATPRHGWTTIRRFAVDTSGAALVEFGITLPFLLLLFAVIIEGSRMMWSYEAAITGVRDAARYLARVAPSDICPDGTFSAEAVQEVENKVKETAAGNSPFPGGVTVTDVRSDYTCSDGDPIDYRNNPAPVAVVEADVTITFPFSGLFTLIGGSLPTITTTIADRSRIFGT